MGGQSMKSAGDRNYGSDLDSGCAFGNFRSEYASLLNDIIINPNELYDSTHCRMNGSVFDIFYPSGHNTVSKTLLKGPDYVRYVLSIYPRKEDFSNFRRIVLRPRFFEAGNVHLAAIYLPEVKTLVYYLHYPHSYMLPKNGFVSDEHAGYDISRMADQHNLGKGKPDDPEKIELPPLLYYLYMISNSRRIDIDKFFIRTDALPSDGIIQELRSISYHYSRFGY
jgi:hypothetical protein